MGRASSVSLIRFNPPFFPSRRAARQLFYYGNHTACHCLRRVVKHRQYSAQGTQTTYFYHYRKLIMCVDRRDFLRLSAGVAGAVALSGIEAEAGVDAAQAAEFTRDLRPLPGR